MVRLSFNNSPDPWNTLVSWTCRLNSCTRISFVKVIRSTKNQVRGCWTKTGHGSYNFARPPRCSALLRLDPYVHRIPDHKNSPVFRHELFFRPKTVTKSHNFVRSRRCPVDPGGSTEQPINAAKKGQIPGIPPPFYTFADDVRHQAYASPKLKLASGPTCHMTTA